MSFFSSSSNSFSGISQPKVRQEGFHLPSPSPSTGHPPSPPPGPFDLFLTHSSHHAHQGNNNGNGHTANGGGGGNGNGSLSGGSSGGLPSLSLPDAFSRTNTMDLTDELAMSLMNPASPVTSNERSTHTPPAHQSQNHGTEQAHMHNIFDISAPPSSHFTGAGGHAFSLPQPSHRPDLPPLSQPASLTAAHLHGHYDHGNYHGHSGQNGFLGGRDTFPAHFNSTIPPLSSHHDPHPPSLALSASGANDLTDPFGPFTPTSASSVPARDSESPQPLAGTTRKRADSRSATDSGRSPSRSRSRVRPSTTSAQSQSQGGGPTRTTKSASRRRDSFTLPPHLSHSHSHSHSHSMSHTQTQLGQHLHNLPSPPLGGSGSGHRPSSIVIPPHGGPGGALSPLGNMSGLGSALSPLAPNGTGIGQSSGWFGVNGVNVNGINGNGHSMGAGANPGSAPGAEFSLPTPDSVGHGPFGTFGTSLTDVSYSVGSMGISPKDTVTPGTRKEDGNSELDPAAKHLTHERAAIVNEKRRRRRESHNAVERRRRDNINEKISELATLIPQVMLDPTSSMGTNAGACDDKKDKDGDIDGDADDLEKPSAKSKSGKGEKGEKEGSAQPVKANKGMILRKSVEYIRYLQQLVGAQAARNRELETRLTDAGIVPPAPSEPMPIAFPGGDTSPQADELAGLFGAEGLHAFDDRAMELGGVNGIANGINGGFATQFGGLEPMVEMDMEMDVEGVHEINGNRLGNSATGSSDAGDDREQDEQEHDMENQERGSSVSASGISDTSSPQERRDASSDRSEEQNFSSLCNDREERGRRGRDGKVHISGAGVHKSPSVSSLTGRLSRRRSKLVAVKEESTGMEV